MLIPLLLTSLIATWTAPLCAPGEFERTTQEPEAQAPPDQPASPGLVETGLYVPAQRWALVIGASDYSNLGRLSFAARDAEAFAETLTDDFGFEEGAIRLLTDNQEKPELRPTAGNMFLALRRLLADPRRQETDLFVFYFAGHGIGDEAGDFLLPLDGALETVHDVGLSVDAILEELTSAGMRNVLFVVDGCRTGKQNTFGAELWKRAEAANLAVILSCEPGQQAYEDRRLGGGVFTHFLVDKLEDPEQVDSASGALWASKVAASVRSGVEAWTSRGFDGAQVPQVWTDPTRDVLLGAKLPKQSGETVQSFLSEVQGLAPERYPAAWASFAEELYMGGRLAECAESLKAAEQLFDLPPQLLYMFADSLQATGRLAEMKRVQDQLRAADPDSFYTLTAIAHDLSGETSARERYEASAQLLEDYGVGTEDLALLVAFNFATGGPAEEARWVLAEMLPHFEAGTRGEAYAAYMALLLDGRYDEALARLKAAEELPGGYPGNWRMRVERRGLLTEMKRQDELEELYAECIADWPQAGEWLAQRAKARFDERRWDEALADAKAAMARDLEPWALLLAVRAAGIDAQQLHDAAKSLAALFPNSWHAQLALAMTTLDSEATHQAALDAAKRLAPGLGPWSAEVAAIQYERAGEALEKDAISGAYYSNVRYQLLDVLSDRAGAMDQGEGWELLCKLAAFASRNEQLADLIELYLGEALDQGKLERPLVGTVAAALLDAGRLERARQAIALAAPASGLAKSWPWYEAGWLLAADRDEEARELLDGLAPPAGSLAESAPFIQACLAARSGDPDRARAILSSAGPPTPGNGLAEVLAGLTWETLGETDRADEAFGPILGMTGAQPFFAKAAAWRALGRRALSSDERAVLAWAAGRDGLGNPLARELSFAAEPSLDAFRGTVELEVTESGGELQATGASLLLTVRKGGKVNGTLELPASEEHPDGDVWSFRGMIDRYGNLEAELSGAGRPAKVFTKLAPVDTYATCQPLAEHGLLIHVMDEAARLSSWSARLRP